MDDRDFHVELDTVGRDMDRRYFFKLLGAAGAVLGTVGYTQPEVEAPPPGAPPVPEPPEVELLRVRLVNGQDVVAETLVPTELRGTRWYHLGRDWRFTGLSEDLTFDDVQVRLPDRLMDSLSDVLGDLSDDWAWKSLWKKDGKRPITAYRGNDLTVSWSPVLLEIRGD